MKKTMLVIVLIIVSSAYSFAQHHQSIYIGEELRSIKNLSDSDIQAITNGDGWGFAKLAELNGSPPYTCARNAGGIEFDR